MSPSEKEDDAKGSGAPPEPLCLFCFPEERTLARTYVDPLPRESEIRKGGASKWEGRTKEREDSWMKKRTEARMRRQRTKESVGNLRSFLLTSVRHGNLAPEPRLPSLFEVLETVKDAWPSPSTRNVALRRHEDSSKRQTTISDEPKMKGERIESRCPPQLLTRRLSMPEELMRKFSVKERTSEESEANKTAVDVSPSSSSTVETARRRDPGRGEATPGGDSRRVQPTRADASQQTSDSEGGKPERRQRVLQGDYYRQGRRIIKVRAMEGGPRSPTTASGREETDESETTESFPSSSSPTQLPKRESSSGNLSSESDNLRCTCAELSSKETSTDLYLSGKSTLSQTVSDKSVSTQDSTVSINSVSTRGSTVSDDSNSTTPEMERTSAKETTTSPDYSPRTPRNRKNRRRDRRVDVSFDHGRACPKHSRNRSDHCPVHSENPKITANAATNTDRLPEEKDPEETPKPPPEVHYKWAKLSQEELYLMQQLRHRRFVETQAKSFDPPPPSHDTPSLNAPPTQLLEPPVLIPRYSALPRSLSMLVNTSSPDTSHHSDSDSLPDSLEDQPVTHLHRLYYDTKKESKPVRGDASVVEDTKKKAREPRGRAFFVSIKDPFGEGELLESLKKIPQPPEKIKNQIFERHLNLCARHKLLHKVEPPKKKSEDSQKRKKQASKEEEAEKTPRTKKNPPEDGKRLEKTKTSGGEKPKREQQEAGKKKKEAKDAKGRFNSKIPVLMSSRSGSSSPEGEAEPKEKPPRPKIRLSRQKEESGRGESAPKHQREVETTQIMEIAQTGAELTLQKPQAVIFPSQAPLEPRLQAPPGPALRLPSVRQPWNKPLLLPQARRSPIGKFRQRFEVIPEEKSSSLSSAEEKNPKRIDASTSPLPPPDSLQYHSYRVSEVPNLIVAKITDKHLETLPYVKGNDNQKIILFSSKPQNSTKGRDALIAMNREDFNRLAKGWMNFYKLNDNLENSENEDKLKEEKQEKPIDQKEIPPGGKPRGEEPELADSIRLDCSNTILRTARSTPLTEPRRQGKKETSLPELRSPPRRSPQTHESTPLGSLPRVASPPAHEDTDSDSTDYMEPPSPRVPPLPIDDIPSDDATVSSSDSEFDCTKPQPTSQSFKGLQFTRALKKGTSFETSRFGKKKNSGWSVTVAGTVELSRSAPDLEMRLSFPAHGGPPVVSQSDSGFAEDSNYSKLSESLQDLTSMSRRNSGNSKQKWMVTVKNPQKGDKEGRHSNSTNPLLPDLEPTPSRNPKKVLKDVLLEERMKRLVARKMRRIWPKVQNAIKKEFLTESGRLVIEGESEEGSCLSVRGSAVSMERKRKPPTMTERDVTRRYTSRANDQDDRTTGATASHTGIL